MTFTGRAAIECKVGFCRFAPAASTTTMIESSPTATRRTGHRRRGAAAGKFTCHEAGIDHGLRPAHGHGEPENDPCEADRPASAGDSRSTMRAIAGIRIPVRRDCLESRDSGPTGRVARPVAVRSPAPPDSSPGWPADFPSPTSRGIENQRHGHRPRRQHPHRRPISRSPTIGEPFGHPAEQIRQAELLHRLLTLVLVKFAQEILPVALLGTLMALEGKQISELFDRWFHCD